MSGIPEDFSSMKAKMNKNIRFALEEANKALEEICKSADSSPEKKFKYSLDFIGQYTSLMNGEMKKREFDENMKFKKLNREIKQHEVNEIRGVDENNSLAPVNQSKFSPTMN